MRDAPIAIGLRYSLVDHGGCLLGRRNDLAINRDVAKQRYRIILLQIIRTTLGRCDAAGNGEHRRVILARFI